VVDLLPQLQAALADRYTIGGEVGHGGMGVVYRAWDVKHARAIALKVVRPELGSVLAVERFLREIQLAAKLQHPHIVPLYDSGKGAGALFYVMPLVEGESLRARLARERQLSLDDALQITREVADALSYAHSRDVIHRDIKPENILLAGGHAMVVDFGIGRAITAAGGDQLTESGISIGTPAYMSPEQATGDNRVDGRSDLYSLACVLYEMLAGHPPFLGATTQEVIARHTLDPVPSLRTARNTVPLAFEAAIQRALAKVPADRFVTASKFVDALNRALTAPATAGMERPHTSRRTRLVLGLGVVVVAAGITTAVQLRRPPVYVPGRVVVAPLENQARDPLLEEFTRQLATTLPDAIAREGVGEPVPAATVRDLLAQSRGTPGDVAEWLARRTRAGLELRGACSRAAAGTTCQMDLLRMPAKTLRISVSVTGDPAQPTFGAQLTERVLIALLLQGAYGDRTTWLGEYIPRSLGAVRAFEQAWTSDDWKYLSEAFRLDTGWVDAAAIATEDSSDAAADATLARLASRPRLLTGERENIALHQATRRADPELAFELARRRFAVNPELWVDPLTVYAVVTGRATIALTVSSYADSALHPVGAERLPYLFRGYALHQLGRYRDQLGLARDLQRRFPTHEVAYRGIEVAALAGLDEVDSLRRRLAQWDATPEPSPRGASAGTRAFGAGLELMAHGHEQVGREVLAGTLPLYRRLRNAEGYNPNEVLVLMWTDQLDEALRTALAALPTMRSMADSLNYLGPLGAIAARQGKTADAMRYDRILATAQQRVALAGEVAFQRATIASRLGDREGAVRFLEEARARARFGNSSAGHWNVHRWPDFFALRGYPPYDRFLRPRG
jgi:protein kinase-like protein